MIKSADVIFDAPGGSVYLELLGKGVYSLNYDYRKKISWAMSVGVQYFDQVFFTSLMYYHFSGRRHRFEMGGGLSGGFVPVDGFGAGIMIHSVFGYRYQKKKGLIFRAGLTPSLTVPFVESGRYLFLPFPGVSLG